MIVLYKHAIFDNIDLQENNNLLKKRIEFSLRLHFFLDLYTSSWKNSI